MISEKLDHINFIIAKATVKENERLAEQLGEVIKERNFIFSDDLVLSIKIKPPSSIIASLPDPLKETFIRFKELTREKIYLLYFSLRTKYKVGLLKQLGQLE